MKIRTSFKGKVLTVSREPGEKRAATESAFWYMLRNALRAKGHDAIKKEMTKDGHMVSDGVYYVRTRGPGFLAWDGSYMVRNVAKDFNAGRPVYLILLRT